MSSYVHNAQIKNINPIFPFYKLKESLSALLCSEIKKMAVVEVYYFEREGGS